MNTRTKKTFLYVVIMAVLAIVLSAVRGNAPEQIKQVDIANKATCVNGINSLASAKMQKEMLDQQVLLSASAGRGEEAAAFGVQVTELKTIIKIFEELIADPKLNCKQYMPEK